MMIINTVAYKFMTFNRNGHKMFFFFYRPLQEKKKKSWILIIIN